MIRISFLDSELVLLVLGVVLVPDDVLVPRIVRDKVIHSVNVQSRGMPNIQISHPCTFAITSYEHATTLGMGEKLTTQFLSPAVLATVQG